VIDLTLPNKASGVQHAHHGPELQLQFTYKKLYNPNALLKGAPMRLSSLA
jgi:hypothetical protein